MRIKTVLSLSLALSAPTFANDGVCDAQEAADGLCFVSPSGFVVEALVGPNGEFPVINGKGNSVFEYLITGPGMNGGSCAGIHDVSHGDILVPDCIDIISSNPPIELLPDGDPSCGFGGAAETNVVKWDVEVDCGGSAVFGFVVEGEVGTEMTDFLLKSSTDCDVAMILGPACGPIRYCEGGVNSTGVPGSIDYSGNPSIADNDFYLSGSDLPPDQPGWFFMGTEQEMTPFGDGYQCLGGDIVRLQKIAIEVTGDTDFHVDFTTPPMNQITAGVPWYFQLYYRDPAGGGAGYNTTDALCVTFAP